MHPLKAIKELFPGEAPSEPYDENWVYLIKNPKVKKLFRNSQKEPHQEATANEEVGETIEVPNSTLDSQVLQPREFTESTTEEAIRLFDTKIGHSY